MLTLKGHTEPINCLCFSPDGRWLASTAGSEAFLWEPLVSTEPVRVPPTGHGLINPHTEAAFSPSGERLWLTHHLRGLGEQGSILGYRSLSAIEAFERSSFDVGEPELLAQASDGETLLLASRSPSSRAHLRLWVIEALMRRLERPIHLGDLAYVYRGRSAVLVAGKSHTILGSLSPQLSRLKDRSEHGWGLRFNTHRSGVRGAAFLNESRYITAGPNALHVHEVPHVVSLRIIRKTVPQFISTLAASARGDRVAVGHNGGLVNILETESFSEVATFRWPIGNVTRLAFAPDGLRCAAGGQKGTIIMWDLE